MADLIIHRADHSVLRRKLGLHRHLRAAHGGAAVNALYLIAGLITLALLIYLVLALLKPEWFG